MLKATLTLMIYRGLKPFGYRSKLMVRGSGAYVFGVDPIGGEAA